MDIVYKPSDIARFFLSQENHGIDNLKLNKIIYIVLGYSLGLYDYNIFEEEVEAWMYGPVIPTIYSKYREYGGRTIPKENDEETGMLNIKDNGRLYLILNFIKERYNTQTGIDLMWLTHGEGTPWSNYYRGHSERNTIPRKAIRKYYRNFLSG